MPGKITPTEELLRKDMGAFYKQQESDPNGFDDWGELTAHAVFEYKKEIERLRQLLTQNGIALGSWDDPFPV